MLDYDSIHAAGSMLGSASLIVLDEDTCIVRAAAVSDEALSKTLAQVRPWSLMVVVVNDDDYVDDILKSFR